MALLKQEFIDLADEFIDDEFSDFKKSLIMRTSAAVVFGTAQTYTLEPTTGSYYGIELEIDLKMFESSLIEISEFMIFTNVSQWTTIPDLDNVDLIFGGVKMNIIAVKKDAANAAYFMLVKRK